MIQDLIVVALSVSFVVSFVDRWLPLPMFRGAAALGLSLGSGWILDYVGWDLVFFSMACSFVVLILILLGERLATPATVVVGNRSR